MSDSEDQIEYNQLKENQKQNIAQSSSGSRAIHERRVSFAPGTFREFRRRDEDIESSWRNRSGS
jgi:hypothetical protein